jgi:iron uptake system component EfeO
MGDRDELLPRAGEGSSKVTPTRALGRLVLIPLLVVAVTATLIVGAVLRSTAIQRPAALATSEDIPVSASHSACDADWARPSPGTHTFLVHNAGLQPTGVDLINIADGADYGEIEALAPGASRPMRVTLGAGTYAFRCTPEEADAFTGSALRIGGGSRQESPSVVPVTENDLLEPLREYQDYVQSGLNVLIAETQTLQRAVQSGDLVATRKAWLTAHMQYERLGAAYGAFGDYDTEINGLPNGLPNGVQDPNFTGFLRIEYGLWHGQSLSSLQPIVTTLLQNEQALRAAFPTQQIDPLNLTLEAHEILEETLQHVLTGESDQGSGTELATTSANLDGTVEVLTVLRPVLATRYPLSRVDSSMARFRALLNAQQHPDGTWTSLTALPTTQREQLDASLDQLLERLAPIAVIAEPRRTS